MQVRQLAKHTVHTLLTGIKLPLHDGTQFPLYVYNKGSMQVMQYDAEEHWEQGLLQAKQA